MSDSFNSDPRSFALELVENQQVSADHLLLCCLKYMSTDDVKDMLDCNELSPRFDEDDDSDDDEDNELEDWLSDLDDGDHDIEAMRSDIENGNLEVGNDEAANNYLHENIVLESLTNGNFAQAKEQCAKYGLDYGIIKHDFDRQ